MRPAIVNTVRPSYCNLTIFSTGAVGHLGFDEKWTSAKFGSARLNYCDVINKMATAHHIGFLFLHAKPHTKVCLVVSMYSHNLTMMHLVVELNCHLSQLSVWLGNPYLSHFTCSQS